MMTDANPPRTRSLRIFVVEDHPDTAKYLCLFLARMGHTVCSARSMGEALAAWPEARCEVLVSDIGLPDGDGYELLERLGPPRPVYAIAMSGLEIDFAQKRSHAAGYRHYLVKPFQPDDLEPLLEEAARLAHGAAD
jgi:two-component system CheB/CheR fusion protein